MGGYRDKLISKIKRCLRLGYLLLQISGVLLDDLVALGILVGDGQVAG